MVCVANCAVSRFPESKSKTKEGFCEVKGTFIKRGESAQIGTDCLSYNCLMDYTMSAFS